LTLPVKDQSLNMKVGESEYRIRLDEEQLHSTIRPLISNESRITVGNPFASSFTLSRSLPLKPQDDTPPVSIMIVDFSHLSKITFYSKVPQVEGLTVRHLPFGSTTKLEDLRSRTSQSPKLRVREGESSELVPRKEKHKKRKSELKESASPAIESVETPSKPKKSKKNKKSHE
jgi:hypothetical protein